MRYLDSTSASAAARARGRSGDPERGSVLLLVLGVFSFLSLVLAGYLGWVRFELAGVQHYRAELEARQAARDAAMAVIQALLADPTPTVAGKGDEWLAYLDHWTPVPPPATPVDSAPGEGAPLGADVTGEAKLEDASARINLNTAPEALLTALPKANAAAIHQFVTWRDGSRADQAGASLWLQSLTAASQVPGLAGGLGDWSGLVDVLGGVNVNATPDDAFKQLLIASGLSPFTAASVADALAQDQREHKPPVTTLDALADQLPGLDHTEVERLWPYLDTTGEIDVNTAPTAVLAALIKWAGGDPAQAAQLVGNGATAPLKSVQGVLSRLHVERPKQLAAQLGVSSTHFRIWARATVPFTMGAGGEGKVTAAATGAVGDTAGAGRSETPPGSRELSESEDSPANGVQVEIEATLARRWESKPGRWQVQVLSWRETP